MIVNYSDEKVQEHDIPKVFFTSDTHFSQERTFKFSRRPFNNVKEMDETIIANWNNLVKENDTVFHLGDFGNYSLVEKLNGNIILIFGNYELQDMKEKFGGDFNKFSAYLKSLGFSHIVEKGLDVTIPKIENEKIYLVHEPLACRQKQFNLFGHIHEKCLVKRFGLNVGIDNFNFKPATVDDVVFYKNAIQNHYDNNVFCNEKDLKDEQILQAGIKEE